MEALSRSAWAEIDLSSISHNTRAVSRLVAPSALCAVVKADSYGHEAELVARTVLANGAAWLAVATVEEAIVLREANINAPILLLIEPERRSVEVALRAELTVSVDHPDLIWEMDAARERIWGDRREVAIQIHLDTGMNRAGASSEEAVEIARLARSAGFVVDGLWSHFAVADSLRDGRAFTFEQLKRFEATRLALAAMGCSPRLCHIANSAAATAYPASRYDMVRTGIELYGYPPSMQVPFAGLRPALSLKARVTHVRTVRRGDAISYGRRRELTRDSVVATIPIGYADGVPRTLFDGEGDVLIGGKRCPIAGVITMDQMMADTGPDSGVEVGDEVTLIGRQDGEFIGADEWAERTGTIAYEILARIGSRVPRIFVTDELEN